MELRTNKAAKALNQTPPEDPNGMDQQAMNDKTKIWLSEQEEEPDTGWTTQKIARNKERWHKAAQINMHSRNKSYGYRSLTMHSRNQSYGYKTINMLSRNQSYGYKIFQ